MKVIKKGREQKGWSKEYKCTGKGNGGGGCGAILLVSEGDLYQTASHHYDGSSEYYTTFRCPCCSVQTDVEDVPSSVKVRMREKRRSGGNNEND
jgi:hypothetical protein